MSIAAITAVEQEAEAVSNPEDAPTDITPEMQAETELTAEISRLWDRHRKKATAERKTLVELQAIREELGRKLGEIKPLVCRMGRASEWGWFLKQQSIPKATADRLVKKYGPDGGQPKKVLNEEVVTENEVKKFKESVIKKARRLLLNEYDKYHFVFGLAEEFGIVDKYGNLIEEPEEPEDEVEPYDDEPGDDLLWGRGGSSSEVIGADVAEPEPVLDDTDNLVALYAAEQKRKIKL
jgi:hypothetical protein